MTELRISDGFVEKEIGSDKSDKKETPVLNEEILGKLLEAAYVLQEHNRLMQEMELRVEPQAKMREAESPPTFPAATIAQISPEESAQNDYTLTLAQIVETQHKIQLRHLELQDAMALVAQRVAEIARAGGAAIGILDGKKMRYRAAAGMMALPVGTDLPSEKSLCSSCLKTGQVIRCADVDSEFLIDSGECHRRGVQSLIAVPVYHEGGIAGGLELYYATAQAFTEQDVHTCQLMAGLVTEALARDEELTWKQSLASERAVMLDALEKLKPNLAALAGAPASTPSKDRGSNTTGASAALRMAPYTCRKCGHDLVGGEVFCGKCGTPRGGGSEPPDLQSKLASLWHMQEAAKLDGVTMTPPNDEMTRRESSANPDRLHAEKPLADSILAHSIEEEMPDLFAVTDTPHSETLAGEDLAHSQIDDTAQPKTDFELEASEAQDSNSPGVALVKTERNVDWSSAASARDFLQQLASGKPGALDRFWRARRGDIYLAVAGILVAVVICWGIWSDHSVGATENPTTAAADHKKTDPDADLSLFDRMLISLGLAEAPPSPETRGNPDAQVWVDLHTALYYCPGADLYGKTPKGKFTTQRDAQLDQFAPAYRKACE
jgi:putative methionine-R-sulfoxide reductase with GAF domain